MKFKRESKPLLISKIHRTLGNGSFAMKTNIQFIVFAVKQAKAAEKFGFTRNECCRNLKTALHQYWQNKTLGLNGIARKEDIPRSKAALGKPRNACIVEHVVPLMVIVNWLMEMDEDSLTEAAVSELLTKWFTVRLITRDEDARLTERKLRYKMPDGWDEKNKFARYDEVGIELVSQADELKK